MSKTFYTKRFGKVELIALFAKEAEGTVTAVIKYKTVEPDFMITTSGQKYQVGSYKVEHTEKLTAQLVGEDEFDKYVGVALALTKLDFASKNSFRKANHVNKYITSEAAALLMSYEGFGSEKEFIEYVDKNLVIVK